MRKALRVLLWLLVAAGALVAGTRLPRLLSELEYFRLSDFRLEGGGALTLDVVLDLMDVPEGASYWDDPSPWADPLREHPMVRSARTRRKFPRTLVITLEERVPVAFVATPVLEPVDRDGVLLPLDPARRRLDLPVLQGVAPNTAGLRLLAAEADRLASAEPRLVALLSELALDERGDVVARLSDGPVVVRFRPRLSSRRAREAIAVLAHARARRTGATADLIDLRYEGQVVVHFSEEGRTGP